MNSFWSSDILTGSQTGEHAYTAVVEFWSSDILTGSQTLYVADDRAASFGAVTF